LHLIRTFSTDPHEDRTAIPSQPQPTCIVIAGILGHWPVFSVFYLDVLIFYYNFLKNASSVFKLPFGNTFQPVFALFSFPSFFNIRYQNATHNSMACRISHNSYQGDCSLVILGSLNFAFKEEK
jgi:hypothetical protein